MSRLTAIAAAAKGIAAGLCQTLADYRKDFEALRRMEQSQQRAMLTLLRSTAVICEMEKQAMLARKIEDDEDRRLQR